MKKRPKISTYLLLAITLSIMTSSCKNSEENDPNAVKDIDGNTYTIITIGTQQWLKDNLRTTKFNDGTPVPLVTDNAVWEALGTAGYCWFENNSSQNKDPYGALYNWYAASTGKLCPTGWHVPDEADWIELENHLGGSGVAGGKMKEQGTTYWNAPNTGATNSSNFSGRGQGQRNTDGTFGYMKEYGEYWSTTEGAIYNAKTRGMDSNSEYLYGFGSAKDKICGLAVRCIKD